ncbi:hypothetical protein D3C71_901540 [compost metagenome]
MQGGEFDGDARALIDAAAMGGLADGVDGLLVGGEITLGVFFRQCRFPQHVVGVAETPVFHGARVRQRLGYGLAGDELLPHQAHRHVHTLADQRLAALADQPLEGAVEACLVVGGHQLAGDEQAPGGGIDEQGGALAQMLAPVATAYLVADQGIAGRLVGDAQQRLRQTHQGHPFLGGEGELLQQPLHQALTAAGALLVAQLLGDAHGELLGGLGLLLGQAGLLQQHGHGLGLGAAIGGGDGGAQHGLRQDALGKLEEDLDPLLGQGLDGLFPGGSGQTGVLGRGQAALQLFQIGEDRLLDQPVGGAIQGLRRLLEPVAGRFVEFNAKGGGGHGTSCV